MRPLVWVAGPSEAEIVGRLLVEFRDWSGRDWPTDNVFVAGVQRLMDDRQTDFLLGCRHDDCPPEGVCQLRYRYGLWLAANDCWLEDLYVRPSGRRAGLGGALLAAALARASERGCRRVELDVSEGNEAALALYGRFGFTPESKQPGRRDLLLGRRLGTARPTI